MNSREPPKPAAILATPINVEESRAQRLQRQQSRFRDRGGIFVPSSRNTLADILLGKAPPLKKSRRSTSASPLKRKSLGSTSAQPANLTDIQISAKRTFAKQSRKSVGGSKGDDETVISTKVDRKGKSKATSDDKNDLAKSSQSSSKTKAAATKKAKPKAQVGTKNMKRTETKENVGSSSKTSRPMPKSKPIGKNVKGSTAGISATHSVNNTRSIIAKLNIPNNSVASSSKPQITQNVNVKQPIDVLSANPPPKRRKSYLYSSGGSEDEYVPKTRKTTKPKGKTKQSISTTTKTASTTKPNKPSTPTNSSSITNTRLPDIPEEDEEDISDYDGRENHRVDGATASKSSALAKKLVNKNIRPSAAELNVQHKPSKRTSAKGKSHPLPPDTQSKPQEAPARATKHHSKHADSEDEKATAKRTPKSTTKKRSAKEAELDEVPQPPLKTHKKCAIKNDLKSKSVPEAEFPAGAHKSSVESQGSSRRSKKRSHLPEPDEEDVALNDRTERTTKRKKIDGNKHDAGQPREKEKSDTTKKATKARAKKMTVAEAQHSRTKSTKTVKRQEHATTVPAQNTPVSVTRRGPPKSVLQRLKDSQPDILDSEPDPIDFLS